MKTFTLIRDELVQIWIRETYEVQAETIEEAVELVKNEDGNCIGFELITESIMSIDPDHEQRSTVEIYDESMNLLYHNK